MNTEFQVIINSSVFVEFIHPGEGRVIATIRIAGAGYVRMTREDATSWVTVDESLDKDRMPAEAKIAFDIEDVYHSAMAKLMLDE